MAEARPRRRWTWGRFKAFTRRHIVGVQTASGRAMDVVFIIAVFVGITALALESVPEIHEAHARALAIVEVVVGSMFVAEYLARIWVAGDRIKYVFSFFGVVDLVAILPFLFQGFGLAYLRLFRVLRIFAVLKVTKYTDASAVLLTSLKESRSKIAVFLTAVFVLVSVVGFTMHAIEPQTFPTVPHAIWWTVVTITTVGYGDFVPETVLGKAVAAAAMIFAFGIIAVPTGIVAVEYGQAARGPRPGVICPRCRRDRHEPEANFCATCGEGIR